MFRSLYVIDIFHPRWDHFTGKYTYTAKTFPWYKEDTYFIIFSNTQGDALKYFKENCGGFNILFEGEPAMNTVHPGENRNTLIVFEVQERFFPEE